MDRAAEKEKKEVKEEYYQMGCCRSQKTSLILLLFGFYFLIFSIIEFVLNTSESHYVCDLTCTGNNCTGLTGQLRFDQKKDINIYLTYDVPQNHIRNKHSFNLFQKINYIDENKQTCSGLLTNRQMGKTLSATGRPLPPDDPAIPCGLLTKLFPLGIMRIFSTKTNSSVDIDTTLINAQTQIPYENVNLDRQWVDMSDPRFRNWMDISLSRETIKLWGIIKNNNLQEYRVQFILNEEPVGKLQVTLTDSKAEGGYNIPLCVFCFVSAVICFAFSTLSYIYLSNRGDNKVWSEETDRKEQAAQLR